MERKRNGTNELSKRLNERVARKYPELSTRLTLYRMKVMSQQAPLIHIFD